MSLGKTIAQLRTRKGWTQAQLAEHVGMTSAHINRLEHDRMKPRPKTLERLAEAFGTSIADLTQAVEHPLAADWARQDPELGQLVGQIPLLNDEQRNALRTFLRSMVTCQQIQRLTSLAVNS